MTGVLEVLETVLIKNGLVTAFAVVGATVWFSYFISDRLTKGRLHGSAVAIMLGLCAAYVGGLITGGEKGIADIPIFAGIGFMGGAMLRDLAIVATAFGVRMDLNPIPTGRWFRAVELKLYTQSLKKMYMQGGRANKEEIR